MGRITDRLREKGTLVSDGAWGTFIHEKGFAPMRHLNRGTFCDPMIFMKWH